MTTLRHQTQALCRYLRNTKAVSALEYAILVGAVAAGLGTAVVNFRTEIVDSITDLRNSMTASVDSVVGSNSNSGDSSNDGDSSN